MLIDQSQPRMLLWFAVDHIMKEALHFRARIIFAVVENQHISKIDSKSTLKLERSIDPTEHSHSGDTLQSCLEFLGIFDLEAMVHMRLRKMFCLYAINMAKGSDSLLGSIAGVLVLDAI